MNPPHVSVVIPVHNGERFIADAIHSALDQTLAHLEVVVVDDGSTDGTSAVLATFKDHRLVIVGQEHQGLAAARNAGVRRAAADAIAFLDADDMWLASKLSTQLPYLREGVVVYSDVFRWDGSTDGDLGGFEPLDRFAEDRTKFTGDILRPLLAQNFVHPSTVVLRRRDIEHVGPFDEALLASEDWDLWLRCAETMRFERVAHPLACIRIRGDSLQSDALLMRRTGAKVLEGAERRLRASGAWDAGSIGAVGLGYFATRNMLLAARYLGIAALLRPWQFRWWRWLGASLVWRLIRRRRAVQVSES
jgi:glycosyltransferase involved in cell wall biosynthesis